MENQFKWDTFIRNKVNHYLGKKAQRSPASVPKPGAWGAAGISKMAAPAQTAPWLLAGGQEVTLAVLNARLDLAPSSACSNLQV